MLDLLYAKSWRISDDELRELRFEAAVDMYDRLMPCRHTPSVLRFMAERCNLHWGYQFWACCHAFGIVPSFLDFCAHWHTEADVPASADFLSLRIYRNGEGFVSHPYDAWVAHHGVSDAELDFADYWA